MELTEEQKKELLDEIREGIKDNMDALGQKVVENVRQSIYTQTLRIIQTEASNIVLSIVRTKDQKFQSMVEQICDEIFVKEKEDIKNTIKLNIARYFKS